MPSSGSPGNRDAGAPASGTLATEAVESTAFASAALAPPVGSYLGITFVEPDPIDGTTGDDNVTLTNGGDTYDAGAGIPRSLRFV